MGCFCLWCLELGCQHVLEQALMLLLDPTGCRQPPPTRGCRVFGSALLLWIPLLPLVLVLRQFLRSQAGASK